MTRSRTYSKMYRKGSISALELSTIPSPDFSDVRSHGAFFSSLPHHRLPSTLHAFYDLHHIFQHALNIGEFSFIIHPRLNFPITPTFHHFRTTSLRFSCLWDLGNRLLFTRSVIFLMCAGKICSA